ncbi:hypothetical protein SteCoe_15489 [Stentor coeruleus]|uniref:Uncharacterized protein n=1 Tax=Stentor coeruleus TaxID=5963 RepID=A0A1R2C3N8_9CILI|nr:hypothetical protein SteCoe_15489 [Stentor coeruleus]
MLQVIPEEEPKILKNKQHTLYNEKPKVKPNSKFLMTKKNDLAYKTPGENYQETLNIGFTQDLKPRKSNDLTHELQSNIKNQLKSYDQIHNKLLQPSKSLNSLTKTQSKLTNHMKNAPFKDLIDDNEDIKKTYSEVFSKSSKILGQQDVYSIWNMKPEDILKMLKKEVVSMQEKLNKNENVIGEREKENFELKLYIDKCHEIKGLEYKEDIRRVGCGKCFIC